MDEIIEKKLKPESVAVDERGIAANQVKILQILDRISKKTGFFFQLKAF